MLEFLSVVFYASVTCRDLCHAWPDGGHYTQLRKNVGSRQNLKKTWTELYTQHYKLHVVHFSTFITDAKFYECFVLRDIHFQWTATIQGFLHYKGTIACIQPWLMWEGQGLVVAVALWRRGVAIVVSDLCFFCPLAMHSVSGVCCQSVLWHDGVIMLQHWTVAMIQVV